MQKHKWYNEIVAWASGAEIEYFDDDIGEWCNCTSHTLWYEDDTYRIKAQPKEPQYLYVYKEPKSDVVGAKQQVFITIEKGLYFGAEPIGKIKLEVDDEAS